MTITNENETPKKSLNFIEQMVENDLKEGLNGGRIQTRFPPEPNGHLHIGHVKAICIDFGIAEKYNGICNLRFDDTNPVKEDVEYVDSIKSDIQWLGFHWENLYYASDYFQQLYDLAIFFIKEGKAYVDEQSAETIAQQKGTPTTPGTESPFRNRPISESLDLFERMNKGDFADGSMVLRAKIDMAHSNMHFRDPIIYRIITTHPHHRTGTKWKVYPMYDFAHGQSDYFEGVTHSLCTLEFEVHRPLYDWFIDQFVEEGAYRPKQREFNRLNITYTVMSKRKLLQLVEEGLVNGWDDPRMPTVCGLRRRGYTATSIRNFIDSIGYTKVEGMIDVSLLEHAIREDLKPKADRVCAIFDPIKLIITNYPENATEILITENNPENEKSGTREMPFGRELYIERSDFMEDAPKNFFRLTPNGREVRLKSAYIVQCTGFKKDADGNVTEVYCTYDPTTKSGTEGGNKKVKSTINWVNIHSCIDAEVRLYDRLFSVEDPLASEKDFHELINPESLKILQGCKVEASLKDAKPLSNFQFLKIGYFTVDEESTKDHLIFNRTVSLKDTWAKKTE
ncbi:MAG: glutamine--tRNA ligase/YqeY domain fusion protein [Paludibacteraceae bacterium]|jgi:glutaminyl-tRNA synthetase|nr:glutamine--tRNA ligase/YqeY domain fusion protein [Paludibacteraceae bacterium]MDI9536531.1 glutamine--tRNA ligase/YqeY domain fusion protein [Bacteroidota bacterium]MBP9039673.1 glutamine--tRNA ligase/YqeY domain fusion protein [Paludibacteraceae bacterium]HPW96735.1 glutamine--tRNA ligase/YqeY domain fusion protein [Paludibacteraceae bacterium]HQP80687.1 glutamine--tRNA ligase/YqeY domain fusion protein [Paludibacteraceae bacterium]